MQAYVPVKPVVFALENDVRADTHGKIASYVAKHNIVRLLEDLVAFLVQHHPSQPWQFLATHYQKILPEVKLGVCPQTLLRDMEVENERPSVIEQPEVYQSWLDENGVHMAFQQAIRSLATSKVQDPYTAILEFIQEQAVMAKSKPRTDSF
mmetsp:Transcript_39165/g.75059  ORF Transcript_39165/g.75059 Transcript_39165/m.75059 type:complete len:151 (-) Transcript_39165:665-1117(-)|eukprot:CAMPEP_0114256278 /NCGR_PEP_ID=MMETSP0058-20121206/18058_1 /TAXON_ID=36894 /ORGANISM="Pyramimonas parkeae, CCMP726" /LENGTH=150 /DNA_ID=CAMNT_0001370815 /DNA_START=211 /DNA_END=663 /DNA_ORIENTATION=-